MKRWMVVSPPYETLLEIVCDGQGPWGTVADVVEVDADTRADAIAFGVKLMLQDRESKWCRDQRSDGLSPYAGIRAIDMTQEA